MGYDTKHACRTSSQQSQTKSRSAVSCSWLIRRMKRLCQRQRRHIPAMTATPALPPPRPLALATSGRLQSSRVTEGRISGRGKVAVVDVASIISFLFFFFIFSRRSFLGYFFCEFFI